MNTPNKLVGDYYIRPKIIGRGNFSTIYEGFHHQLNKPVAVKKLDVENIHKLKIYVSRELELHQKLEHPNIVAMFDHHLDYENNSIYIFMEHCGKGDFFTYQAKRPMMEWAINKYMRQFTNGLKYLHSLSIFHRDLKPHNLLLDYEYTLKISDFGLSKNELEGSVISLHKTYCGSPLYMAPEILFHSFYDNKSDLWSVGIILYEWITGRHPYKSKNLYELMNHLKTGNFQIPADIKASISKDLATLLDQLLRKNPEARIDWPALFENPWIQRDQVLEIENDLMAFDAGSGCFPSTRAHEGKQFVFVEDYKKFQDEQASFFTKTLKTEMATCMKPTFAFSMKSASTHKSDGIGEIDPLTDFTGIEIHSDSAETSTDSDEEPLEHIEETLKNAMMTIQTPMDINKPLRTHLNFTLESQSFRDKSINEINRNPAITSASTTSTPESTSSISSSLKTFVYNIWNGIKSNSNSPKITPN